MKNFIKIAFLIIAFTFFAGQAQAKDIYINKNMQAGQDCLTELTACISFLDALNKATEGDIIYLKSDVLDTVNDNFELKGIAIEWNNNQLTLRWENISLLGDTTLNNLKFSIIPSGAKPTSYIFMNGKNLTLNNVTTSFANVAGDYLPTIVAGSANNAVNTSDFSLIINNATGEKHFKEIITSSLDGSATNITIKLWENVKAEKVKSLGVVSGIVETASKVTTNFEKIATLKTKGIIANADFDITGVENLILEDNSNIPVANFGQLKTLALGNNTILSLKNAGNLNLQNFSSQDNATIRLWDSNTFTASQITSDKKITFHIANNSIVNADTVFVTIPTDKSHLIEWTATNGIFEKISDNAGKTTFGIKFYTLNKERLTEVLNEFDTLTTDQQDLVDVDIYNTAIEALQNAQNQNEIDIATIALENEIKKAKWEPVDNFATLKYEAKKNIDSLSHLSEEQKNIFKKNIDDATSQDAINTIVEQAKTENEKIKKQQEEIILKKSELKKLLDIANNPTTINGKTDETIKALNTEKEKSQKIYDNINATLDEINNAIKSLDTAIKNLTNKPSTPTSSGGSSSGGGSSGGGSSGGGSSGGSVSSTATIAPITTTSTVTDIYAEKRKYFENKNKTLKTKIVDGKTVVYGVSNTHKSCSTIDNILWDYKSDFQINFSDVNSSHDVNSLQKLAKMGIINGTRPGIFEPNRGITRAEFLSIILKIHCHDVTKNANENIFYDLDPSTWQAGVVNTAYKLGIINGYEKDAKGTPFKPNQYISKVEAFAIMMRIADIEIGENFKETYTDKKAEWQTNLLSITQYLGITHPNKTNNKFYPNDIITRNNIVSSILDIIKLY